MHSMDCSLESEPYSEFQVNIFINKRDTAKCHFFFFLHDADKVITMPRVFSENSQAKNHHLDNLYLLSADAFNLDHLFGKELTHSHTMTPFDTPGKQAF